MMFQKAPLRIMQLRKHLHEHSLLFAGVVFKDCANPFSGKRLKGNKRGTDPIAFIFVVFALDSAWFHGDGLHHIPDQLARALIESYFQCTSSASGAASIRFFRSLRIPS